MTIFWIITPILIRNEYRAEIGAPFYELGLFGAIQIWVLIAAIRHRFGSLSHQFRRGVRDVARFSSFLPGTPIATPIYGFILGHLFATRESMLQPAGASRGTEDELIT